MTCLCCPIVLRDTGKAPKWFRGSHFGLDCFHRALAALLAISDRRSGDNALALAGPPFGPPSFPRETAAGFFSRASMRSNTCLASKIGSVLERLGIPI